MSQTKGEAITEILDPLDGRFDWKARVLFFFNENIIMLSDCQIKARKIVIISRWPKA